MKKPNKEEINKVRLLPELAEEYGLTEEETIRACCFFSGNFYENAGKALEASKRVAITEKELVPFIISAFTFKRCSRCGAVGRYTEFYKNISHWTGCEAWRKECYNASPKARCNTDSLEQLEGDLLAGVEQEEGTDVFSAGFEGYYNALDKLTVEELAQLSKQTEVTK